MQPVNLNSNPLLKYVDLPKPLNSSKEESPLAKVSRVLSQAFKAISINATILKSAVSNLIKQFHREEATDYIFENQIITATKNEGKYSDAEKYYDLQRTPASLSDLGKKVTLQRNVPHGDMTLAPKLQDNGKCAGGVAQFLGDYLTYGDIHSTAQKFSEGIPFEGAIQQQIYLNFVSEEKKQSYIKSPFLKKMDSLIQNYVNQKGAIFLFNPDELKAEGLSDDQVTIIKALHSYLEAGGIELHANNQLQKKISLQNWVDTFFDGKKIPESDAFDLQLIETFLTFHNPAAIIDDETTLAFCDLTIESVLVDDQGPDELLESISKLEPGAYKLNLPHHTVALIVTNDGISYLYDPSYAVGWFLSGEKRMRIERLLKTYKSRKENNVIEIIANVGKKILGKDNSADQTNLTGYSLYKVKKT